MCDTYIRTQPVTDTDTHPHYSTPLHGTHHQRFYGRLAVLLSASHMDDVPGVRFPLLWFCLLSHLLLLLAGGRGTWSLWKLDLYIVLSCDLLHMCTPCSQHGAVVLMGNGTSYGDLCILQWAGEGWGRGRSREWGGEGCAFRDTTETKQPACGSRWDCCDSNLQSVCQLKLESFSCPPEPAPCTVHDKAWYYRTRWYACSSGEAASVCVRACKRTSDKYIIWGASLCCVVGVGVCHHSKTQDLP